MNLSHSDVKRHSLRGALVRALAADEEYDPGSEAELQRQCFLWLRTHEDERLHWTFAVGNERARRSERDRMKRQGVLAGVSDVFIPVAAGGKCGLFIELKYGRNRSTAAQQNFQNAMRLAGYAAHEIRTLASFCRCVEMYLGAR